MMVLFKKSTHIHHIPSFVEFLIVTISLIAILVPLRVISKTIFAGEWIGSLGLISVVFGMVLFLSKKEKLGIFGQMFIRQIIKNHQGKRKWFVYIQTALFLSIGIITIFSIHVGNTENYLLKEQVIAEFNKQEIVIDSTINYDSIQQITSQVSLEEQVRVIVALPLLTIQNFKIFSVVLAVTDQLMGGWVMYFWQIMIIEIIEITILLGITRKLFLKNI